MIWLGKILGEGAFIRAGERSITVWMCVRKWVYMFINVDILLQGILDAENKFTFIPMR